MKKEIFRRLGDHLLPSRSSDEVRLRRSTPVSCMPIRDRILNEKFPAKRERKLGHVAITRSCGFRVLLATDRNPRYEWQGLRWCRIFQIKKVLAQARRARYDRELIELADALLEWYDRESMQMEQDFPVNRTLH